MKDTTRLIKSRANWREKAKAGTSKVRSLQRKIERRDKKIIHLQDQLAEMQTKILKPAVVEISSPIAAQEVRITCVFIVLFGVVSFRSVPRILTSLTHWLPALKWNPHFTSVINWTMRVGLAKLNAVGEMTKPWVALIDISIDEGTKKALTVLRVPLDIMANARAISLKDCTCIGVIVSETWNGELVAKALTSVFGKAGIPRAILMDGGKDLCKGVRLWKSETDNNQVFIIQDIGHWTANGLKAAFSKLKSFTDFIACVSSAGKRLGQSTLSYLRPPKIRTKGRFQNLSYIAKWAELMLEIFDAEKSPLEPDQMRKLRKFLPRFSQFKPFLAKFIFGLRVASDAQQILKKNGLNRSTYHACMDLIEQLPSRSKLRARLKSWLQRHLSIQCQLGIGQTPIPVSTDVLESLFGKFKVIVARNPKAQFNRIVLTMPAICGDVSKDYIDHCLQETSHLDLKEWEKNYVKNSNSRKRRKLKLNLSRSKNCPSLVA